MFLRGKSFVFLALLSFVAACGGDSRPSETPTSEPARPDAAPTARAEAPAERPTGPTIIFLGDSLTAGLGLSVDQSYPSLVQARLKQEGLDFTVVNAGVSGDTSAGGLRRLEWAMSEGDPKVLVVALGGNDGLRGLPPEQLEANLAEIIERAQKRGLTVLLAGMEAPPNFGDDYTSRFRAVYASLAKRYDVALIPFLLEGVAGDPALNQADGIHPNQRGAEIIADLVWRTLSPALEHTRTTTSR